MRFLLLHAKIYPLPLLRHSLLTGEGQGGGENDWDPRLFISIPPTPLETVS